MRRTLRDDHHFPAALYSSIHKQMRAAHLFGLDLGRLQIGDGRNLVLALGLVVVDVLLGLDHRHVVGQRLLGAALALRVVRQHDLDLDAQHSLAQQHVPGGGIDVVVDGVSGVDHQTVDELHRLGTLTAQLAGHDHLAALGARLHDEAQHTVARAAHRQSSGQLEAQRLGLGNGAQTTSGHLLGVQLDGAGSEVESNWLPRRRK